MIEKQLDSCLNAMKAWMIENDKLLNVDRELKEQAYKAYDECLTGSQHLSKHLKKLQNIIDKALVKNQAPF